MGLNKHTIIQYLKTKPILYLLLAIPFVWIVEILNMGSIWIFSFSALGVVPLAGLIGEATESLSRHTGPRLGGLLNATLGNAAELIITIVAIREGLLELVKASITGSILGNLLLVLGMSMLLGGIRNGVQKFDRTTASRNSILLVLTVLILLVPSILSHYVGATEPTPSFKVEALNLGVAFVMIVLYILGLIYGFKSHHGTLSPDEDDIDITSPSWSIAQSFVVLALATVGVGVLSEILVGTIEPVVSGLGISEFFIGVIFIPIIGNVAEHLVAVQSASKNKMALSVEIAVASSLQIALFVAPVLIFLSLLMGNPLTLIFNQFELLALIAGVFIAALVSEDGESNWLEGCELLAIYLILSLAFFLL
jgi:Ca2+:H+ antiporter